MTTHWGILRTAVEEEPELDLLFAGAIRCTVRVSSAVTGSTGGEMPQPIYTHYISGATLPSGVMLDRAEILESDMPAQRAANVLLANSDTDHGGGGHGALAMRGTPADPVPAVEYLNAGSIGLSLSAGLSGVSSVSVPNVVSRAYLLRADFPVDRAQNVPMVNALTGRGGTHAAVAAGRIRFPIPVTLDKASKSVAFSASSPVVTTSASRPSMSLTIAAGELPNDCDLPIDQIGYLDAARNIALVNADI